jgi:Domain of unknown function (DUF4340)
MRARSFLILSAITVVVTAAAVVAVVSEDHPRSSIESGGPVFPGLSDRLGEVVAVVVRDAERTATIHRVDNGWGLVESNNYPVPADKVRDLVRSLVELAKSEAKTDRPERYSRLAVNDVSAPDAQSKEVILQDAAGAPIADLIVGNPAAGLGDDGATYVRVAGESQAWLARGALHPSTEPRDWVESKLMELPAAAIHRIKIAHPDKSTVTVTRDSAGGGGFQLAELPADGKLKRPDAVEAVVQALSDIPIEDLAPIDEEMFPKDKTIVVTIEQEDGKKIAFKIAEGQGDRWLRFVDGMAPESLPQAGEGMMFRVPAWKLSPLERKLPELVEPASGS